jgi:hypothetical protein
MCDEQTRVGIGRDHVGIPFRDRVFYKRATGFCHGRALCGSDKTNPGIVKRANGSGARPIIITHKDGAWGVWGERGFCPNYSLPASEPSTRSSPLATLAIRSKSSLSDVSSFHKVGMHEPFSHVGLRAARAGHRESISASSCVTMYGIRKKQSIGACAAHRAVRSPTLDLSRNSGPAMRAPAGCGRNRSSGLRGAAAEGSGVEPCRP